MAILIREVKKEDKDEITELAKQMVESLQEPFLQTLWLGLLQLFFEGLEKETEEEKDMNIFCAENTTKDELIGMMIAKIETDRKQMKYGKTSFWYVKPEYRGKQIGYKLNLKAHEFFQQNGVAYTDINIREDERAKNIVEKLGFTKLFTRYRKYF